MKSNELSQKLEQEKNEALDLQYQEENADMFTFDEARHAYTLNGKPLTGVTTILGIIAKPALIPWAVTMTVDYVRQHLTNLDDLDEVLVEAKKAHNKKKTDAGDLGTIVHNAIEEYIKTNQIPQLDKQAMTMFMNFKNWADEFVEEFVESEKRLYSKKHWYAGTVDLVLKDKQGKYWIADIKTSSGVYPEYYAQMGGYHIAYDEMGNMHPIHGYIIIHIPKTGKTEQYGIEDTEMCKQFFLHALGLYKIKNNIII